MFREDGNKVSDGSTEDTHRGEELGVCIWGVAVLQHCSLQSISVELTI